MNQQGIESHVWKWEHVKEACLDLKSWFWFSLMVSISYVNYTFPCSSYTNSCRIPSGGITTFGPLIIESFGFNSLNTILLNVPFGAVQLIATMGGAWLATTWRKKGPVLALLCLPPIAGCVMLLKIPHDDAHKGPLLVGYYIISVYPGITPLIYSWSAATTGILLVGQCVGNIIGPNLYTTEEAPLYHRGLLSNLALFCVLWLLIMMNMAYLSFLNKKHEKRRVALGKDAKIVDHSMFVVGAVPTDKDGMPVQQVADDNAFKDLTDWQNEDFVYVY